MTEKLTDAFRERLARSVVQNSTLDYSDVLRALKDADHDTDHVELDRGDWILLTDARADEMACDYIDESLWAFNPSFLSGLTGLDTVVFKRLSDLCEGANDAIRSIVNATCGIEKLQDAIISADGRGHFLNSYDGEEIDLIGGWYLIRVN